MPSESLCDCCGSEFDGNPWDVGGLAYCDDCHADHCEGDGDDCTHRLEATDGR